MLNAKSMRRLGGATALVCLAVAGCKTMDDVTTAVSDVGNAAWDIAVIALGGIPTPADDGSACYPERESYYGAVREAAATDRILDAAGEILTEVFRQSVSSQLGPFAQMTQDAFVIAVGQLRHGIVDDQQRIQAYNARFDDLYGCRRTAARTINTDLKRGRVTRANAVAQMTLTRNAMVEDIDVAKQTNVVIEERLQGFEVSVQQAKAKAKQENQPQKVREIRTAESALQTNQTVLQNTVSSVESAETAAAGPGFQISFLFDPITPVRLAFRAIIGGTPEDGPS